MKNLILLIIAMIFLLSEGISQVAVNQDESEAHPSAMLDVQSQNMGFLMPRLTTAQQVQIENPALGLLIFNTDSVNFWYYDGDKWIALVANPSLTIQPWVCGDILNYEGRQYATVQIGDQCWMQQNLNVGQIIESEQDQTNNSTIEKYCYNNEQANCDEYGGLYQWNEMMLYTQEEGAQGICPHGWHIPSNAEWNILEDMFGGTETAGGHLKETGTLHWEWPNTGASNESGFSALPGGAIFNPDEFVELHMHGYFRSSTMVNETATWFRHMDFNSSLIFRDLNDKSWGFSVRCIKNSL